MKISLILAADENDAIGMENGLPWPKMSADLKWFKKLTMGHHIIMGRKTHESMGGELPGRKNIVITRNANRTYPQSIEVTESLADALKYAKEHDETEVFVIGGAMVFKDAVLQADTFYLTRIHGRFEADTWLPATNNKEWKITERLDFEPDEKNPYAYSFITMRKEGTE